MSTALPLSPGDVVGNYRVVRLIGVGGLGSVYEVEHSTIRLRAALRVLAPSLILNREQRFLREMHASSAFRHPGIVRTLEMGQLPDGQLWLLMEYLEGETLVERIKKRRVGRPAGEVDHLQELLFQVASTLSALHEQGLFHGDLKPSNILLVSDEAVFGRERIKLLDFGVIKLSSSSSLEMSENAQGTPRTASGRLLGTPVYMAPEQASTRIVDGKADVYALGVIAYELLTGEPPFTDSVGSVFALLTRKVLEDAPPLVIANAPELAALVMAMLQREAARRPTMKHVAKTLARLGGRGTHLQQLQAQRTPVDPATNSLPQQREASNKSPAHDSMASRWRWVRIALPALLFALLLGRAYFSWLQIHINSSPDMQHSGIMPIIDGGSVEPYFDDDYKALRNGGFSIDTPHEMWIDSQYDVYVRIIADLFNKQEIEKLLKYDGAVVEPAEVGHRVAVELRAYPEADFVIEPMWSEKVAALDLPVVAQTPSQWRWQVRPLRPGDQKTLRFIATGILQTRGHEYRTSPHVIDRTVRVRVRGSEAVSAAASFWPGPRYIVLLAVAFLLTGLAIILLRRLRLNWPQAGSQPDEKQEAQLKAAVPPGSALLEIPKSRAELRAFLHKNFPTGDALTTFLIDYFPAVSKQCNASILYDAKINLLFERCEIQEIVDALRHRFPSQMERIPGN